MKRPWISKAGSSRKHLWIPKAWASRKGLLILGIGILAILLPAFSTPRAAEKKAKEYQESIKREEGTLEKLRKDLDENEKKLKELSKQEKGVNSELHLLEKKIDLTDRLVSELEKDVSSRQKELEGLEGRIHSVRGKLGSRQEGFYARLRELYERRSAHPLDLVFGSSSFSSAASRVYYLTLILAEDQRQIAEYTGLSDELDRDRSAHSRKLAEIASRRDEVKVEKASLVKTEKKKEKLLASVKKQKSDREKAIEQLKQETKRLSSLIEDLERKRLAAVEREGRAAVPPPGVYSLDRAAGMLRWPVAGEVITPFGKQFNSDLRTQVTSNGIDIRATKGAPVHAVAPGRIEFSDWWQSYGKMVIVSHSNGFYSLYAHLSRVLIGVGKDVKEGDVIGEVGDTGSLSGPYLHFEIRKGREALNPLAYLRKP